MDFVLHAALTYFLLIKKRYFSSDKVDSNRDSLNILQKISSNETESPTIDGFEKKSFYKS